jgi:hypothetical protein
VIFIIPDIVLVPNYTTSISEGSLYFGVLVVRAYFD